MFSGKNSFEKKKISIQIEDLDAKILLKVSKQLFKDWSNFNFWYFSDKLKKPIFDLFSGTGKWGYWDENSRTIGINISLFENYSWETVIYVLKHEMAHQYSYEILSGQNEKPHGEGFQKACLILSIPGYATCEFNEDVSEIAEHKSIVKKVKKMFALAQSANENESKIAMVMANRLLLKHNISLIDDDMSQDYLSCFLGEMSGRTSNEKVLISNILNDYFFVEVIWVPSYDVERDVKGSRLQIFGSKENVEIAEYVYHFLINQSIHLWEQYKRLNRLKGNRSKKSFVLGLLSGFSDKLKIEKSSNKERGLIWLGDKKLDDYFNKANPRVTHASKSSSNVNGDVLSDGRQKGRSLTLAFGIKNKSNLSGKIEHKHY
ncbi:MAG: hypothetical protein COA79_25455 [Planctomycetota bacterium]|nr:MAG: hypothetical protein COA79_25455 [Planctomycetota bacterium]